MSALDAVKPTGVSDSFFEKASSVILNLSTTDAQLMKFLNEVYSSDSVSEGSLQAINILMNRRNQRSELISNLEEKHHRGVMSIISNLK